MISIIIPTFNEENNIENLLLRITNAFRGSDYDYEIIVVDDNSTDGTCQILEKYTSKFPVSIFKKKGKKGKSYSLIEGFREASGDIFAVLDANLQYPPEAIIEMAQAIGESCDIVVANRVDDKTSSFGRFFKRNFNLGKLLFGIGCDIQSSLKIFKREVFETVKFKPRSAWAFDLEFLIRAKNAGFKPKIYDINFQKKQRVTTFAKIVLGETKDAIILKAKPSSPIPLEPKSEHGMQGAGVAHKGKRFVTHTTLSYQNSALLNFSEWQKLSLFAIFSAIFIGLIYDWLTTVSVVVAILSAVYFIDVIFNLYLVLKSLRSFSEITFSDSEIDGLDEGSLPVYSIICPLYKEAKVLPKFLDSINNLDWPKDKLDVLLLLEEDDKATQRAVLKAHLPYWVRAVVVPNSVPKTKPKACNYGLSLARGEYVVVYDAEDVPDKYQLKKAFIAFGKSDESVVCVQAKLNFYNPNQNILTRIFTAEYSHWFDLTLVGLQSIDTYIPLGGTSNHFRTQDLLNLEAWDPLNVTEDADLGMRLFKAGYKTAMIDSTTYEEANSRLGNWLRQRSRWIKGYMQTYLVHMRNPLELMRENGIHSLIFQLVVGGKIAFIFINPILWVLTISYFVLNRFVGSTIESLYPSYIFYMAGVSLVFGNFLFIYYYMIGCAKRGQWSLIKYVFLVPFYWVAVSIAGCKALYQLFFKPHFWEKTVHGLYLKEETSSDEIGFIQAEKEENKLLIFKNFQKVRNKVFEKRALISGGFLIISAIIVNFLNFAFSAYVGRVLSFADFALVGLAGAFLTILSNFFGAYYAAVSYRSGFLVGKYGDGAGHDFWKYALQKSIYPSLVLGAIWLMLSPFLMQYFHTNNILLFGLFGILAFVGLVNGANLGFMSAKLMFNSLAVSQLVEPITKLLFAVVLVYFGLKTWTFSAIPLGFIATFIVGWFLVSKNIRPEQHLAYDDETKNFPFKFFVGSLLIGFSTTAFLSLDILMAKHFLSPIEAGQYTLLSLAGKMVYFLGGLTAPFLIPYISRDVGAERNYHRKISLLLFATFLLSFVGFLFFGLFGFITIPLLFGQKALVIVPQLTFFTLGMMCYSISDVIVNYYLVRGFYTFSLATSLLVILQIISINLFHSNFSSIAFDMAIVWIIHLAITVSLHFGISYVKIFEDNLSAFADLFTRAGEAKEGQESILIFNWRDSKHVWAGGAELYVHEIAKCLVREGFKVTVFCGNDGNNLRNEDVDGVEVIRRGGLYTVYVWAVLYYFFKFRKRYSFVIDCENGIPFFTPIFVKEPVCGLVYHVHQEVFRTRLRFPLAQIGKFLEGVAMPFVYRNTKLITISQSSKLEMEKIGLGRNVPIEIVEPGVDPQLRPGIKTLNPSVVYVGRLQSYKSVDVLIKAINEVRREVPEVTLTIAGEGESQESLEMLARDLDLAGVVRFLGKISESAKRELLASSWVFAQPSMLEGWGIAVIEANASGTPVVASDVCGLRDSVKNPGSGFLVPWGDHLEFAEKIKIFLKNENLRKAFSDYSVEWARNFNWEKCSRKILYILQDIKLRKEIRFGEVAEIFQPNKI